MRAVLVSMVAVESESISDHFFFFGELERAGLQFHRVVEAGVVGNDKAIVEALDDGKVKLSQVGGYLGDVSNPFLVRS